MRIASFNVNGIGARLPRLLEWLATSGTDVACLQEVKTQNESFPFRALEEAGWHALVHGQKGFNGVAILTRQPAREIRVGLQGDPDDVQARWIEAETGGIHVVSLYLPNGNPRPGPKFDYKLAWMERLRLRAAELFASELPVVLAGDYNVVPTDHQEDIARPEAMREDALMRPESRAAFRRLLAQGWTDALRAHRPDDELYTFWDYQAGAWPRNWGFRIDHLLLSPAAADRLCDAGVDRDVRGQEKASDHAPTWIRLD